MQRPMRIISDPKIARVLVDPMRREIVRLLAEGEKTENDLAESMGLSDPSVGHHLKVLMDTGLIRVARREAEEHGILQKFYESNAVIYLVDSHNMSKEIDRYFMPISLERVRGVMASACMILGEEIRLSEIDAEDLAKSYAAALIHVSRSFSKPWRGTREELLTKLYTASLRHLLKNPVQMPETVRHLLARAFAVQRH
jgi:DNA-binding transcriptional ArsR family regulator